jgi:predicted PurR-regulated permease PerM
MDRRLFVTLTVFSALLALLFLVYTILSPLLDTLGWSAVAGISTFPLYRRLRGRLRGRDTLAASLMTPAVIVMLVLPFLVFVSVLAGESIRFYQLLEKSADSGLPVAVKDFLSHPYIAPLIERAMPYMSTVEPDIRAVLLPAVKNIASTLLSYSTAIIRNVFFMLIKLVIMVIALFFLYRDGERALGRFMSVLTVKGEDIAVLLGTVKRVLSAVIYGILLTCVVQGVLGGAGFWICGLPSPVLFGSLMAVAAVIPVVGTALIWLPGALYLLARGDVLQGVFLLLWGGVAVGMSDNLIRPLFISGKAHMPILVIALGVLGGVFAFGPLGVIGGPIVLAVAVAIFELYSRRISPEGQAGEDARGDG